MGVPATNLNLNTILTQVQQLCGNWRSYAQQAVTTLAAGSVNSDYVFSFLDVMRSNWTRLGVLAGAPGLDAYATQAIQGYAGTLSVDITATRNAAVAVVNWVVTNFPKDSTNSFILSHTLNGDGTRTPRIFTSTDTAGLRTALNSFIATIS